MADITNDKGSLEQQPASNTNPADRSGREEQKKMDRSAEKSAERASETIRRDEGDHEKFTKFGGS